MLWDHGYTAALGGMGATKDSPIGDGYYAPMRPIFDLVAQLCPHPAYRLITVESSPRLPEVRIFQLFGSRLGSSTLLLEDHSSNPNHDGHLHIFDVEYAQNYVTTFSPNPNLHFDLTVIHSITLTLTLVLRHPCALQRIIGAL